MQKNDDRGIQVKRSMGALLVSYDQSLLRLATPREAELSRLEELRSYLLTQTTGYSGLANRYIGWYGNLKSLLEDVVTEIREKTERI